MRLPGAAEQSLRVVLAPRDITDTCRGLSQGRIAIRAGQRSTGYVWLKVPEQNGYAGNMTVALEEDSTDSETYASTILR